MLLALRRTRPASSASTGSRQDGLPTWGDGRLFILGTEGTIELRKYIDIAGRPGGDHLFLVDRKGVRHIDCSGTKITYGEQLRDDVLNRTETAMPQAHCFHAMELALMAQAKATRIGGERPAGARGMTPALQGRRRRRRRRRQPHRGLPRAAATSIRSRRSATSTRSGRRRSPSEHGIPRRRHRFRRAARASTSTSSTSARPRRCISSRRGRRCSPAATSWSKSRSRARSPRPTRSPSSSGSPASALSPIFQYRFADGIAQLLHLRASGLRRQGLCRDGRDALAAAAGLLRQSLARALGDASSAAASSPTRSTTTIF